MRRAIKCRIRRECPNARWKLTGSLRIIRQSQTTSYTTECGLEPIFKSGIDTGRPSVAACAETLHNVLRRANGNAFFSRCLLQTAHAELFRQGWRQTLSRRTELLKNPVSVSSRTSPSLSVRGKCFVMNSGLSLVRFAETDHPYSALRDVSFIFGGIDDDFHYSKCMHNKPSCQKFFVQPLDFNDGRRVWPEIGLQLQVSAND